MWRRLGKHFLSIGLGQAINLTQQLLLPAAFLHAYGVEGYAAWLVVLAAAGQLGNLDLGLQTYLVNRLTMLHEVGKFGEFRAFNPSACASRSPSRPWGSRCCSAHNCSRSNAGSSSTGPQTRCAPPSSCSARG